MTNTYCNPMTRTRISVLNVSQAFDAKEHPLGQLVNGLVDVFRASYVGMGTHRRLLPHAVAEAKTFVTRVYNIVR